MMETIDDDDKDSIDNDDDKDSIDNDDDKDSIESASYQDVYDLGLKQLRAP
jgi:hypothetical protein